MSTNSGQVVAFPTPTVTWERMHGESRQAFAAFVAYRDAGPTRRIVQVAQECGKSPSLLYRWSARWRWQERADAFDLETDRQRLAENAEQLREDARTHHAVASLFLQRLVDRLRSVDASKLPLSALPAYLEVAVKVQRLALGASTDRAELTTDPERPLEVKVRFVNDWHQGQTIE